jgi:hypothetical protein
MRGLFGTSIALWLMSGQSARAEPAADLVLRGGEIVTMDDHRPLAEALAVRGDRVSQSGFST